MNGTLFFISWCTIAHGEELKMKGYEKIAFFLFYEYLIVCDCIRSCANIICKHCTVQNERNSNRIFMNFYSTQNSN